MKVGQTCIFFVYLPTDYRDLASEERFSSACAVLVKVVHDCCDKYGSIITAGNFNCNVAESSNARSELLLPALPGFQVVGNDHDFTYLHNSGSTSSIDFFSIEMESDQ